MPRFGLKPNRPQHDAGILIEPPLAIGTMCAATAAAEPPPEPPDEYRSNHGLRVGPKASGSV